MPRKAKPPTNPYPTGGPQPGPPQPPRAPTGMPYGAHQAAIGAQQAVPVAGPAGTTPTAPAGPAAAGPPPISDEMVLNAARQAKFSPTPLTAPPSRPEPLASGLPIGAGPGPSAMPSARPVAADMLELIATSTGDPLFYELAEKARLRRAP